MATAKATEISIMEVERGRIEFMIRGDSPLICNAMSAKARQQLLLPPPRKNAAEKASSLKHNPLDEFRSSMYFARDPNSPTRIVAKATAFKGALMSAALDLPGASKSQIGRLAYVENDEVPIYGVPELLMSVTRSADMNKTPDVRTRAILPRWACFISVQFTKPILKEQAIVNLMAAAGITQGIGDWRVQKGSGNYGQFALTDPSDKVFQEIVSTGGKEAQDAAIAEPICYDSETEELLAWFDVEVKRRGFKAVS